MAAESGTATVKFVMWLGHLAWQLDEKVHGRRLKLIAWGGVAIVLSWKFEPLRSIYPLFVFLYSSLLFLLFVAWLWWTRRDDGSWSAMHLAERTWLATVGALGALSFPGLFADLQLVCLALGAALMAIAPPLAAIPLRHLGHWATTPIQKLEALENWGLILVVCGVFLSLLRRLLRLRAGRDPVLGSLRDLAQFRTPFPAIDVWETPPETLSPELRPLVTLLRGWHPRRAESEAKYEVSLLRFLRKHLSGVQLSSQQPLADRNGRPLGRLDVVIDNRVVIELKRRLDKAGEADRAIGQMAKYAEAWESGLLVLLVCETRSGFVNDPFVRRLAVATAGSGRVLALAAGSRLLS